MSAVDINMQVAISNMRALMSQGVTYSMSGSRTGTDGTADCSGAVYASLNKAGASLPIGNTETMFVDLPNIGFSKTSGARQYGDIFIWGVQGASSGEAGHTGIFLDADKIIHCNYGSNGVSIDSYNAVRVNAGSPPEAIYRSGKTQTPTGDATSIENTTENMDNAGEIEEYSYIGDKLCIKGWHFASNATKESSGGDPGGGGSSTPGSVDWNSMQSRAQFFVSICTELGIPKNTALALAANAYAESALDPSALEPMEASGAQGHGYFQWSYPSNWGDVPNHMSRSYADAKFQINFAKSVPGQWINVGYGSWGQFWSGQQDPSYLTAAWLMSWERPAQVTDRWTPFTQAVDVNALDFGTSKSESKTRASNEYAKEIMEIYDATTDKLLKTVDVELKYRKDKMEENPNVQGVQWSGIDFCINFEHDNPFYVKFVRLNNDGSKQTLNLQVIFFPHSSSRSEIGHNYCNDDYFKIICTDKNGKHQFVNKILGGVSWSIRANEIPSCSFTVPITEAEKFDGFMDVRVVIYKKVFDGIVKQITLDKDNETATIDLDHKIAEWDFRQIPENYTVKNRTFPDVFSQSPFLYSTDWYVDCDAKAHKEKINYAFSRQGHLEALTKACELSDSIWWRVGTNHDRYVEIGEFGQKKNYMLSESGQTERHIKIIDDVSIEKQFDNVFNVLTAYGEKSDSSQASLTLRDAYLDQQRKGKSLIDGFPIVILNPTVNNEQKNYYTNITKIASNNSLEYAILDEFSINLEQAKMIEKTMSMNDIAPFEQDGDTISDEERAAQSMIVYKAGVKLMRSSGRRREAITVNIGELPCDLNVLDRIYFDYNNSLELFDGCSRYCKKIYQKSDDFYITGIETTFDENLIETNRLTISKELYHNGDSY